MTDDQRPGPSPGRVTERLRHPRHDERDRFLPASPRTRVPERRGSGSLRPPARGTQPRDRNRRSRSPSAPRPFTPPVAVAAVARQCPAGEPVSEWPAPASSCLVCGFGSSCGRPGADNTVDADVDARFFARAVVRRLLRHARRSQPSRRQGRRGEAAARPALARQLGLASPRRNLRALPAAGHPSQHHVLRHAPSPSARARPDAAWLRLPLPRQS